MKQDSLDAKSASDLISLLEGLKKLGNECMTGGSESTLHEAITYYTQGLIRNHVFL